MLTTIHISGGSKMMGECLDLRNRVNSKTKIIGVTMLTSLNDEMIKEIGHSLSVNESINTLASVANKVGIDGVVCSPLEIKLLKEKYPKLELVVPGIRSLKDSFDDQIRVLSAKEAIDHGATYLVVGRPITQDDDPAKAAEEIFKNIQ